MFIFYAFYSLNLDIKWYISNINFHFNEYYLPVIEYIFLFFSMLSLYLWIKKGIYQYDIRSEWIWISWEIIEAKICYGYRNFYKYTIKFYDNNSNEIIFQEKHKGLLEYKEQKQLNETLIEWLEWTKTFPKIDIMYDKFDSNKAIIK
jgi:hypothetical protein